MPSVLSGARWLFDEKNPPKNEWSSSVVSRARTQIPLESLGMDTCARWAAAKRQHTAAFPKDLAIMAEVVLARRQQARHTVLRNDQRPGAFP